jgi:uncharacterized membrane protein YtjA (UPF0391 family)
VKLEVRMRAWAVTFLVVALIAAAIGFSGLAGDAAHAAWGLAIAGIVLAVACGVAGRRPPE